MVALCVMLVLTLDKQGSAHGGDADAERRDFDVSGTVLLGVSLYNPTYAARPDNTGLALFRYAAHVDIDLLGPLLSIPIDLNFFTDRLRGGAAVLAPTEFDVIGGVTSTQDFGPGSLEEGIRVEHDRPIDQGTFTQTYVDARVRVLYALSAFWPGLKPALRDGDITGWFTLGCFMVNPTYAARPDNTGLAFMRYAVHLELSTF